MHENMDSCKMFVGGWSGKENEDLHGGKKSI